MSVSVNRPDAGARKALELAAATGRPPVQQMTPAEARVHFGAPAIDEVDTHREAILFRQDPEDIALAAE